MKKRILAVLLALAMVFSMCPTTVIAAPAVENTVVLTDPIVVTNPLYPDLEPQEIVHTHPVAPAATSENNYGTVEEVAQDVREYVKDRTGTFTVYLRLQVSSFDEETLNREIPAAIKKIWETAMAHTGDPIEGDYIKWQWQQYGIDEIPITGDSSGLTMPITWHVTYYTTAAQEQEMDQAVEDLLEELDLDRKSDYEKIYGIYDWLCHNVVYDDANLNNEAYTLKYTAYAALINGTSVCQGYATLFYRLALELGVDARLIAGTSSGGNHSWNIVELNDLYYNADSTWDANVAEMGGDYQYFLKSNANFPDHARWEEYTTSEFNKAYPMATADYTPGTEPEPTDPEPTEHTHSGGTATCKDKAVCTSCGEAYGELNPNNHTGGKETRDAKDATCTEKGYTGDTYCKGCGTRTASGSEIAATGHSYGDWVVVTEPTTEEEGLEQRTCSACSDVETRSIEKLPEETEPTDPEPTDPEPTEHTHSGGTATCKDKAVCTSCGEAYGELNPNNHTGGKETRDAKDATCTEKGYTGDTYCKGCGTRTASGSEIAATGHSYGDWVVVTEPTTEEEGLEQRTCSACGDVETRSIEKLPEETEPTDPEPTDPEPTDPAPDGKYPITINVWTEGGTYSCREQYAAPGQSVTVDLKPDEGYCLDWFDYSFDGEGGEITLDEWYIDIVMPEGAVTLDIYYAPAHEISVYMDDLIATVYPHVYIEGFKVRADSAPEGRSVYLLVTPYPGMDIDQILVYYASSYPPEMNYLGKNEYGDDIFEIVMADGPIEIYVTSTVLEEDFVDVDENDYFYDPVRWAVRHRITTGVDETHFSPNMTCTRAQVVTFLWRAVGSPNPTTSENPFSDVKETDYFYKAVLWAVENGITSGTGNGRFSPNMACSRAQVATFLWRTVGKPEPTGNENPFTDVKPGQYYTEAVLWAVEYGITTGVGNGKFAPNASCSRGQIVTFLYRVDH